MLPKQQRGSGTLGLREPPLPAVTGRGGGDTCPAYGQQHQDWPRGLAAAVNVAFTLPAYSIVG